MPCAPNPKHESIFLKFETIKFIVVQRKSCLTIYKKKMTWRKRNREM